MVGKTKDELRYDHNNDGIDRRGFLKCMAWAGTGAFCIMQGGVLKSYSLSQMSQMGGKAPAGELSFAQISDSHMGFNKAANPDVVGTMKAAIDKTRIPAAYRRHQPPLETRRVRYRGSNPEERSGEGCLLCARRARHAKR
jgi:hypothetical protein